MEQNDKEILALPLKQLDLVGATNKMLKAAGLQSIGDVLDSGIAGLAKLGLGTAALLEVAKAAKEMGLTWSSEEDVRAAAGPDFAPIVPELPKNIATLVRRTFVLINWQPGTTAMTDAPCQLCRKPLTLYAHFDLRAFPNADLPAVSMQFGRCTMACSKFDPKPGQWLVRLDANGQGDRPAYRIENDYPGDSDLPKPPSERVSLVLNEHHYETIGLDARVGGWPLGAHGLKPWPTCSKCSENLVIALQMQGIHDDDGREQIFVCRKGCSNSGLYRYQPPD